MELFNARQEIVCGCQLVAKILQKSKSFKNEVEATNLAYFGLTAYL
jgi:hypothetical protein